MEYHCFLSGAGRRAVADLATRHDVGDSLLSRVTPASYALYDEPLRRMQDVIGRAAKRAIPADVVARAVAHALTASRPRTRYLVGKDARLRAMMKWMLPTRAQDRVMAWFLGLAHHG